MKQGIHPELKTTLVHCNGCGTEFETHSTVDKITVEICSQCHPFYTGKQKLVDVAGRVDRFKARQAAAADKRQVKSSKSKVVKSTPDLQQTDDKLKALKKQLETKPSEKPAADKGDQ